MLFGGLIIVSHNVERLGEKQEVWWTDASNSRAGLHAQLNDISLLITGHLGNHADDVKALKALVDEQAAAEALQWQVLQYTFVAPPERKPSSWVKAAAAKP